MTNVGFRAEYNAFWKCVQSAAFYLFVQFVKMLTIATCFPPVDESSAFVVKTVGLNYESSS